MSLLEWYESGNAPHEALGRAARKLRNGGALYLGGGVGVEAQQTEKGATKYALTGGGKSETFGGPLSAVIRAFATAGASTATDTPGGTVAVSDPAAAARLRELSEEEAGAKQDIERYERQLKLKAARPWSPGAGTNDDWEVRRIEELRANLKSIAAERARLLAAGKVEEVEQARPGTNFTKIPAANVKRLQPIVDHYKGMAHPFSACVRDQIKHGLSEDHANRRCAVVKDLGRGTTKWRKGASKVAEDALGEALGRVAAIEETLGVGMSVAMAEADVAALPPMAAMVAEGMAQDLALLAVAEHPLGLLVYPLEEFATPKVTEVKRAGGRTFNEELHPRDIIGQFRAKVGSLKQGESASLPDGRTVTRTTRRAFEGTDYHDVTDDKGERVASHASPKLAAESAIGRSMRSTNPKSLGGAKSYSSTMDLPGNEGMAPKMALPTASSFPKGSVAAPRVAGGATVAAAAAARSAEVDEITAKTAAFEKYRAVMRRMDSGPALRRWSAADLRKLLADIEASGHAGASEAVKKRIRDALKAVERGARAQEAAQSGVAMLVEAFSQSAPIQTPAKQDAQHAVGKKAGTAKKSSSSGSGGSKYDESKHKRGAKGTSEGGRFVAKGSSGEDVRAVQHRVGASPDGKFGEKTRQAVMEFQRAHGLQVDGVVGHQTAVAMAGGDGKNAQVGALKGSDKEKLKRLRKGGASLRARRRRKPKAEMASRGRGGAIV